MQKILLFLTVILFFTACSDQKKEAELQSRIDELEIQLDECQNGADKLLAKVKIAAEAKDYETVKSLFKEIESRHPETLEYTEAKNLHNQVIKIEEKKRKEAERKTEAERQEKLQALNKLKKNYDDVLDITWYKQPYFLHDLATNATSIYIGDKNSHRWLRLKMSYYGDHWIFFERAYLSYDGNTKEILFDRYKEKKTDSGHGHVCEWIDVTVTKDVKMFLRELVKSKNAKMRLTGKYTETRNLDDGERNGIRDVLNGYDILEKQK